MDAITEAILFFAWVTFKESQIFLVFSSFQCVDKALQKYWRREKKRKENKIPKTVPVHEYYVVIFSSKLN